MSDPVNQRLSRWQFRKNRKIEKRRKKRQEFAKQRSPQSPHEPPISVQESEQYKTDKQRWEEREKQWRIIEIAKKRAQEKEAEAKRIAQKRWQDTLLNLPLVPPSFSTDVNKDTKKEKSSTTPFKQFIPSSDTTPRKTYRERYLEKKKARKSSKTLP